MRNRCDCFASLAMPTENAERFGDSQVTSLMVIFAPATFLRFVIMDGNPAVSPVAPNTSITGGLVTELLFLADSYVQEFRAAVTDLVDDGVILDRTAFYPGGGGQPWDIGVLLAGGEEFQITRVGRKEGEIIHQIPGALPTPGTEVQGAIDWMRRYLLMRTHTALHILCGVVWRDFGAKVTGGDMQPGAARMDFELEQMSAQFADEVSEKINAEVQASRPVHVGNLTREEAQLEPDLIRTKINLLPAGIREVRTIDISGLDLQADSGTHVANTQEVGRIAVVGHESKGRINKRLRIALADR